MGPGGGSCPLTPPELRRRLIGAGGDLAPAAPPLDWSLGVLLGLFRLTAVNPSEPVFLPRPVPVLPEPLACCVSFVWKNTKKQTNQLNQVKVTGSKGNIWREANRWAKPASVPAPGC